MSLCQKIRPSRLRKNAPLRSLVREMRVSRENLVMPLFFSEGKSAEYIASMPGIKKMGQTALLKEIEKLGKLGIHTVLLFGSSNTRNSDACASYNEKSAFHTLIKKIKENSDCVLITDVCMCAYTDHGHCGIIEKSKIKNQEFTLDNPRTLEVLAKIALSYARAGADIVAPSAMADGQVKAIREALDQNGFLQTAIMSYSAKYASGFYGPFRDIYRSNPLFGDRSGYQMDPANKNEALREVRLDIEQGADMVMVKPALPCLDIIGAVKREILVPLAAYNVSGEYAMLKAAAQKGWLDETACAMEMLTSIKRAGADIIITYWAKEAGQWLSGRE